MNIVALDSAGVVSLYVPYGGGAVPVGAGTTTLPDSIVLDETLGPERIFAVVCDSEIELDKLVEIASTALALAANNPQETSALEIDCKYTSTLIHKVP